MDFVEIEKRVTKLEDQDYIIKLHQRYLSYLDNLQFEKVQDLFVENATVEVRTYGVRKGKKKSLNITPAWPQAVDMSGKAIW